MPPEPDQWRVAITARCLRDDLGMDPGADWRALADTTPIFKALLSRRQQQPEGQELILGVLPLQVHSLHSGDDRGGTWWDAEEGVVWLVGVGLAHDYRHLERLAAHGALLPTIDDYRRLDADVPDPFDLNRMGRDARALIEAARREPGVAIPGELAGRVQVRVCLEDPNPTNALLSVAISHRIARSPDTMPASWMLFIAQAFFPGAPWPDDFWPFAQLIDATEVEPHELALQNFIVLV